jgi:hypothetical protein
MGTRGRHGGSRSKTTGGVLCVGSSSLCRSPSWCSLDCSSHGVWVPARKRRLQRLGRQSSNSSRAISAVSWPVVSSRSHQRSWNDGKPDLVFLEAATVRIFESARSKEALVPLQFPWAVAARTTLPHSDRTGADVGQHDYWTRHWPPRSGVHDHMLGEGEISRSRGRFYRSDALTVPLEEWLPADVSTRTLVMYRTDRSWQIFSNTDKVIRREPGTRRFRSAALSVPPPSPPARSTGRRPWRFLLRTIDITAAGRPDLCPEPAVRLAINSYRHIGFCACNVCCGYLRQSSIRRSSGP